MAATISEKGTCGKTRKKSETVADLNNWEDGETEEVTESLTTLFKGN